MTQDEIMEMAKESGLEQMLIYLKDFEAPKKALETFAGLLTAKYDEHLPEYLHEVFYDEINGAILKEREACARLCENSAGIIDAPSAFINGPSNNATRKAQCFADAIRARGEQA